MVWGVVSGGGKVVGGGARRLVREAVMPKGHWGAVGPGCGDKHSRFRRPMLGRQYFCSACGPEAGGLSFGIPRQMDRR